MAWGPETFCWPSHRPSGATASAFTKPGGDWNSLVVLTMPWAIFLGAGAAALGLAAIIIDCASAPVAAKPKAIVPVTNSRLLSMMFLPFSLAPWRLFLVGMLVQKV